jgi:hypothetical protein
MPRTIEAIIERWRDMPPLRLAKGLDDAMQDWPLGDFGEHPEEGHAVWLTTDHVRCSEMMLTSACVAEILAQAPADVRRLLSEVARLNALINRVEP